MAGGLLIKRVYEPAAPGDGFRLLVDRLWPRGVTREAADLDGWMKDVAPSPQLRTWWRHDPGQWSEFIVRYRDELDHNPAVAELQELRARHDVVTLLFGARDPQLNHAVVLRDYLLDHG
ncbi:DUF488 domain-containing protein [Microbacterium sp. Marseille-Q6965]|uniref:DUF488 domain-containing protein n=1 Tax=Microbacterium sp. Marseille-Q6965 TaxID=2965072 RepID=UPI0021B72178|nr:DUF488 family protein [Microbacterium sp. Marseille-Q6965]